MRAFSPDFLIVRVHTFDQILEHCVDVTALHLARRRRVAFLGIELLRNDPEFLDLLDAGELAVRFFDFSADQLGHAGMLRERREPGVDDAVLARPIGNGVEIDLDQRARKLAPR